MSRYLFGRDRKPGPESKEFRVGPNLAELVEGIPVGSDDDWNLGGWVITDGESNLALPAIHL